MHGESCRLAFYGRLLWLLDDSQQQQELSKLRVFKIKERTGCIERMQPDGTTAICKQLFKKETDISVFTGLTVTTGGGVQGVIDGAFGKSGKFKVCFQNGNVPGPEDKQLFLRFKRYVYDPDKKRKPRQ